MPTKKKVAATKPKHVWVNGRYILESYIPHYGISVDDLSHVVCSKCGAEFSYTEEYEEVHFYNPFGRGEDYSQQLYCNVPCPKCKQRLDMGASLKYTGEAVLLYIPSNPHPDGGSRYAVTARQYVLAVKYEKARYATQSDYYTEKGLSEALAKGEKWWYDR